MEAKNLKPAEQEPKQGGIERFRNAFRSKKNADALRQRVGESSSSSKKEAKEAKAAQKEAEDAQIAFASDRDRVKRVEQWANNTPFYKYPVREDPNPYDTVNQPTSADEHRYPLPDLDGLSSEEIQAYKVGRDKIVNHAQKGLSELSKKYYEDMEKLESKIYPNPTVRHDTLMQRYNTFKYEVQLILDAQTIRMGKLAHKYGFDRKQLLPYTSTTENGGIHQLPDAPRFDD